MSERISETITFHFDDAEQQKRFHERLDGLTPHSTAVSAALRAQENLFITDNQLCGHLAMWVCRQHPYHSVAGVDDVGALIRAFAKMEGWIGGDDLRMRRFADWRAVEKWLFIATAEHPQLLAWNTPRSGEKGEFQFVSRYGGPPPHESFIDIHALFRNVAREAWNESAREDEFDCRVDEGDEPRGLSAAEAPTSAEGVDNKDRAP
jgi:hypothetical protein